LNKCGITVTPDQFWEEWDSPQTQAAIEVAQFPKEITEWIWEIERFPFEVF